MALRTTKDPTLSPRNWRGSGMTNRVRSKWSVIAAKD
jgi:hypothetical protein